MELPEFLAEAIVVGDPCEKVYSGFTAIYLVPKDGDGETFFGGPEEISMPEHDVAAFKIELEPENAEFKSVIKESASGTYFENTLSFNSIRNISAWVHDNKFLKFWLVMEQENRFMISGDDTMPFTFRADFKSGKSIQDSSGWEFVVSSQQLRPYHVVIKS
jgi:hypothetical protein